jgi:hypothetical protein
MKFAGTLGLAATALAIASVPGMAQATSQNERVGVATPDAAIITSTPDVVAAPIVPVVAAPAPVETRVDLHTAAGDGFLPYTETGGNKATATELVRRPLSEAVRSDAAKLEADPDAGIVTVVPFHAGEISQGAILHVKLLTEVSTRTTVAGSDFRAEVTAPMLQGGSVVVPVGAIVDGQVTMVRGGHRIRGAAALHLEPSTVTLPDGTRYVLHARVIDTDVWSNARVDSEGTIKRKDHVKKTLAAMSPTTGGAASAGAVFGGVPGALIGAGVGAGVSTVWWLKQDRQTELRKDVGVVFSLTAPMLVTPVTASAQTGTTGTSGGE